MGQKTGPTKMEEHSSQPPPYSVDQEVRRNQQGYYATAAAGLPLGTSQQQGAGPSNPKQQQNQPQQRQQQPKKKSVVRRIRRAPPGVEVSHCIKYTIFLLNLIFWLMGLFLLGFGMWGVVTKAMDGVDAIAQIAGINFDPMYGFIILGGIVFILATSGCIGALRENTCMLKFFAYSLILIFLAEITVGVLAYVYQDQVFAILESWLDHTIINYHDDPDTQFIMDTMQKSFQCCGSNDGPIDWDNNIYFSCDSPAASKCSVPFSCCVPDGTDVINYQCGYGALEPDLSPDEQRLIIHVGGCVEGIRAWFISNAIVLGIVGGVLVILECLVICLAKSLVNDIECVKSYW